MKPQNKKELLEQYKMRKVIGGVCAIVNTVTGEKFITAQTELSAYQNRFSFSKATGSCVEMKLQRDWIKYGAEAFQLEVLESLEKKEDQSDADFKTDLATLLELKLEKLEKLE